MQSSLTVYKASAGSGKTFTLTIEYIKTLIGQQAANAFSHILAVTFTNKATAEMKDRILQQLYGIWKSIPASNGYLRALKASLNENNITLDDKTIRRRAGNALLAILHNYDRFRVETIDSFFQFILRNLAHELSLTANLKVELNDKQALSKAVDALMEHLNEKTEVLRWILDYVSERISNNEQWDISRELKSFGQWIFKEAYLLHEHKLRQALCNNQLIGTLRKELSLIIKQTKTNAQNAADGFLQQMNQLGISYHTLSNGRFLRFYIDKLSEGNAAANFSTTLQKWTNDPAAMLRKADKQNDALRTAAELLANSLATLRAKQLSCLNNFTTATLAAQHLNPLRLLGEIDKQVSALNQEYNRFLLAKTPILIHELVKQTDAPFLFEKPGVRFTHVMIDEFQDTSLMQWNNFKTLLLESMAKGGSNLLVGDIKQSIYRWRNGDWTILNNIAAEMTRHNPDIRTLNTNFRSERRIIAFNNALFTKAADLLDTTNNSTLKIKDAYADVQQKCPDQKPENGCARILFFNKDDKSCETSMLDDLCLQARTLHDAGLPYNKMTILLRKRRHIAPILQHFAQQMPDVRIVSDEAFLLSASKSVSLLIAAMRCINNPDDAVSLHCLLLHAPCSPVKTAIKTDENNKTYCEIHPTYLKFSASYLKKIKTCDAERWLKNIDELRTLPLYELQEELYKRLGLKDIPDEDAFLFAYFDCVAEYLKDNPPDIGSFLNYWDETLSNKAIPSGEIDGIRIFTIHKSKGLQFHTVLAPYCDWDIEKDMRGRNADDDLLWCETHDYPYNILPVIPITARAEMLDSKFSEDYRKELLQRRVDSLNLLYVCFTRAEKNLFAWCKTDKTLNEKSTIGDLLYAARPLQLDGAKETSTDGQTIEFRLGAPVTTLEAETTASADNRLQPLFTPIAAKMRTFDTQIEFRQSNRTKDFLKSLTNEEEQPADSSKTQTGILLHRIFSTIYTCNDVERAVRQLENEGLLGSKEEKDRLMRQIKKAFLLPQAAQWFDGTAELYNECPIITQEYDETTGNYVILRPDRVMFTAKEAVVVDFKFGKPHKEHRKQVEGYMKQLEAMEPARKVKGYLWYILDDKIEEVKI